MRKFTLIFLVTSLLSLPASIPAQTRPATITDQEFWRLVTDMSEEGGRFAQQFMSNEDSYQAVVPALKTSAPKNGVYIGVGSEQNFTYIVAAQPSLSFIVDIRRDNMLEHLMYKAIFQMSQDRADFISRLFSRKRPAAFNTAASAPELFASFETMDADSGASDQTLQLVRDNLVNAHKFPLTDADIASIGRILNAIRIAGPSSLKGTGDLTTTYAQLMSLTDPAGNNQSYLASEENFRSIQRLENENRVIPLVGDFAGSKALAALGKYLKAQNETVNVFYVSNVERYLFDDFAHGRQFYSNVAGLPLNGSSVFIRSVTTDISKRLGFPLPDGKEKWRTFLVPINDCLQRLNNGGIKGYPDLFAGVK